jgi:hypothetical protein
MSSERRCDAEAFDEKQESLSEGLIPCRLADLGPIQLFANGAYSEQRLLKIAVVFAERRKLGDHDRGRRQHRHPETQNFIFFRGVKQRLGDRNAREPMQHVDQCGLIDRFRRLVIEVGLEEPVFRWAFNPQARSSHAVGSHLDIGFSHHKIDIVAGLGSAVDPEGIAAPEGERYAVGLEG